MPAWLLLVGGAASFYVIIGDDLFDSFEALKDGGFYDVWLVLTAEADPDAMVEESPLVLAYFREFQHLVPALSGALHTVPERPDELVWFADWIYGVMSLLPQRLIPIETPLSVTHYNTFVLTGVYESTIYPGLLG